MGRITSGSFPAFYPSFVRVFRATSQPVSRVRLGNQPTILLPETIGETQPRSYVASATLLQLMSMLLLSMSVASHLACIMQVSHKAVPSVEKRQHKTITVTSACLLVFSHCFTSKVFHVRPYP
jgi:hypothetical protein